MNRIFIRFFIFAFFVASTAHANTVVTASVNPAVAAVGDRLTYEITVTADQQTGAPIKPEAVLGDSAPFELLDSKTLPVDDRTHKLIFTLALFETGRFQLPVYTLHWVDKDNNPHSVSTEPVFVEILSVLKQDQKEPENLDIGPPAEAVLDWRKYILPSAVAAFLLAVLAVVIWWLKKRPKQTVKVIEQEIITPAEAALRRLAELENKNLLGSGQLKNYFTELSDSLREYLEKEFSIDAMEKTTFELESELPKILEGQGPQIISILEMCDSVKFAKAAVPTEEAARAITEARAIIVTTSKINEKKSGVADGMESEKLPV
ncbi:MAG: hypothetical protein ACE5EN_00110 [Nitrospinota bacterium]